MPLSLILILLGIVLAVLVHWGLGVLLIVIGLVLLIFAEGPVGTGWRFGHRKGPVR